MKKSKLVRINLRMYEQDKYLASRVGELGRERDALRRELEDLRGGFNGAVERNVQLVAEFKALEQAHEALQAQHDAALARARKSDEMFSRIQALCGSEDV